MPIAMRPSTMAVTSPTIATNTMGLREELGGGLLGVVRRTGGSSRTVTFLTLPGPSPGNQGPSTLLRLHHSVKPAGQARRATRKRVRSSDDGVLSAPGVERHRGLACIRDNSHTIIPTARRSSWRRPARPSPTASTRHGRTSSPISSAASASQRLGHYSIFMENNDRYLESCAAGERSGLVLHVRELVPHRRGTRIHRRQQRVDGRDHLARQARHRARRDRHQRPRHARARRRRRRDERRRSRPRLRAGARRPSDVTHPRRAGRHRDALLLGHDRSAEGHHPAASRSTARRDAGALRVPPRSVALPRGHGLPVAGAAVPLGAAGRRGVDDPQRWDGHHHGALRSRRVPPPRRALPGDAQPTRADDVQPSAQTAGGRTHPLRPVVARDRRPRCRPVPDTGEGGDDRVVGPDHPRVLRRHRRAGLHGLRQRGVARPQGHRGQGDARPPAHPRRRHARGGEGLAGHDLVRDGDAVRVPQRRREDARGHLRPTAG